MPRKRSERSDGENAVIDDVSAKSVEGSDDATGSDEHTGDGHDEEDGTVGSGDDLYPDDDALDDEGFDDVRPDDEGFEEEDDTSPDAGGDSSGEDEARTGEDDGGQTSGPASGAGGKDASSASRTTNHNRDLGTRGEDAAATFITDHGYEILDRNWRCCFGEADIVALDEDELVFIEVKTRIGIEHGLPEDAITAQKRSKYEKIAAQYLKEHDFVDCPVRFDVVAIMVTNDDPGNGKALLRYHRNAFSHD